MGPLQLAIQGVQNRHAGEQKSHWDKTNKRGNGYFLEWMNEWMNEEEWRVRGWEDNRRALLRYILTCEQ